MSNIRYVLLTLCFLAGIVLSGCAAGQAGNQAGTKAVATAAFAKGAPIKAAFTEPQAAGMKGVAENDRLQLFVDDQTGAVAVRDKQSGDIWRSNPADRDKDPIAQGLNKDLLSSQMTLDYSNNVGQMVTINSYTDSVAYKQIKAEPIPNGVRVTFQFGKAEKSAEDMPKLLSEERFKQLSGKLDKAGKRALMIAYTEDPKKKIYVRNDQALNGFQLERALKAIQDAGYTEEDLKQDMAKLHFTQEKQAARIFQASIEYTLDADGLVVKVPVSRIHYPSDYPVIQLSVLNFFGAGGTKDEGAILVPDGSGALLHFNNGKTKYSSYQQTVFGTDPTLDKTEEAREQPVRLPVFGLIKNGSAWLGIIENGASLATIHADTSGRLNSYNYVYPSFTYLNKDKVTLNANGQQRALPRFQENPMKTDFTVRYAFLSGEQASYQGMARYYQQYLIDKNGLPKQADVQKPEDMPFYLQLIGSISKTKYLAGIPYQALEPLTTFDQAKSIIGQLKKRQIANIHLKYSGWFNGGVDHRVPSSVSVDGAVGGSEGLHDFIAFVKDQGVSFFPDAALLTAHARRGFSVAKDASRTLRGDPAAVYPLDLALNGPDRTQKPSYAVSPHAVGRYADGLLAGLRKFGVGGVSLRDLADQLSSDFRKHDQMYREESEGVSVQALKEFSGDRLKIMADGGNAYAFPFLTDITNAPLSDSGFKIEDEEIPFYQMVVRGFIDYTGAPYNLSTYTDARQYELKCLEYGAGVSFEWIYEPNYQVQDTAFNQLYSVHYEQWIDQAAQIYRDVNDVLKNVRHERIAAHEKLAEGVYKTVYGNGIYVIVNYNRSPVAADGKTIEAESFLTGGGQS